jgi:hypothetical protein
MYRAGLLTTVAEVISKYKLHLVGVEDRGGSEPADKYTATCRGGYALRISGSPAVTTDSSYTHKLTVTITHTKKKSLCPLTLRLFSCLLNSGPNSQLNSPGLPVTKSSNHTLKSSQADF